MNASSFLILENGASADFSAVPKLPVSCFRTELLHAVKEDGCRILAFFAVPEQEDQFTLVAVLGNPQIHKTAVTSAAVADRYPALTPDCEAFHWFEREIAEQYDIIPEGHPWLKPIRFLHKKNQEVLPGVTDYFRVEGAEAHEVAVGPIHAGVIEPGHFRFQCMGETVYHLEIELGYQHRGIEKMMQGPLSRRTLAIAETIAGDSSVAHSLTFCHALEALSGIKADTGSYRLRTIALELERLANHIGDLGALAGDVAFLPTAAFCGRIRGEYLNMTAELCGNRFGRGLIVPGGCAFDLKQDRIERIMQKIKKTYVELLYWT